LSTTRNSGGIAAQAWEGETAMAVGQAAAFGNSMEPPVTEPLLRPMYVIDGTRAAGNRASISDRDDTADPSGGARGGVAAGGGEQVAPARRRDGPEQHDPPVGAGARCAVPGHL
jgi:hypothetical protein